MGAGKTYDLLLRACLTSQAHYHLHSNFNVHPESTMPLAPSPSLQQIGGLWNKSNTTTRTQSDIFRPRDAQRDNWSGLFKKRMMWKKNVGTVYY